MAILLYVITPTSQNGYFIMYTHLQVITTFLLFNIPTSHQVPFYYVNTLTHVQAIKTILLCNHTHTNHNDHFIM